MAQIRLPSSIRFCPAALVAVLLPGVVFAQQPPASATPDPVVVASGEGLVQAVPDRAWITIGTESRAPSPREAQRRNAEAMEPVQQKLRSAGIPADAIRTVAYDLQYEWDYVNNRRVGKGYVARNSIEVRVDDIDRVGELLEIAVGSGATSLSGVRFDLKDRGRHEREALRLAVADARARAEALASAAGRAIDRIIRIDEHGAPGPPIPRPAVRELAADQASFAPPISPGQMELRAGVTLTAVLK